MSVERLPIGAQGGMGRREARIEIIPPINPYSRRHRLRDEDYWGQAGRFSTKCVIYLQEFFIYKYSAPQKLATPLLLTVACPS